MDDSEIFRLIPPTVYGLSQSIKGDRNMRKSIGLAGIFTLAMVVAASGAEAAKCEGMSARKYEKSVAVRREFIGVHCADAAALASREPAYGPPVYQRVVIDAKHDLDIMDFDVVL